MTQPDRRFDDLVESHRRALHGFFRCRVKDEAAVADLLQETWIEAFRHFDTYDETKGSFWVFTKIWADLVLKRHWRARASEARDVGLLSDERGELVGSANESDIPLSDVFGERVMSLEEKLELSRALLELLCRMAVVNRPPHEIIVFGLTRLGWTPGEITAELCDKSLDLLAQQLNDQYAGYVPMANIGTALCPLRHRLSYPLEVLVTDPRTRKALAHLLERVAGHTLLSDYFPADRNREAVTTQWWDSVRRAVINELRSSGRGALL